MPAPALAGRHVVLGVCGGIAAYKAIEVCRQLTDAGARVSPVLTRAATRFVGELTFSALVSEPTRTGLWDSPEPIPHTRLGQTADVVVVVPATARLIGAYAAGISSDLLTATLLATRAPVVVCPAMHTEMWEHPAVTDNVAVLRRRGVHIVEPAEGRLAGGDIGRGRLADPAQIVAAVTAVLTGTPARPVGVASAGSVSGGPGGAGSVSGGPGGAGSVSGGPGGAGSLRGVRALVTAGGTREPIDSVRYVGNRSSGKQGYAIAGELARRGAEVTLVSTVGLAAPPGVAVVAVETAAEMESAVLAGHELVEVVVMAAAVADFRPRAVVGHKLKKADGVPEVILEATPDILAGVAARRRAGQVLVGFAAETPSLEEALEEELEEALEEELEEALEEELEEALEEEELEEALEEEADETAARPAHARPTHAEPTHADPTHADPTHARLVAYARGKLEAKGVDLVVANDVAAPGVGFAHDTNAVVIVDRSGSVVDTGLVTKAEVASAVVDAIEAARRAPATAPPPSPRTVRPGPSSVTAETPKERL